MTDSDSSIEQAARLREAICNAYGPHDLAGYQDESRCRAIADAAIAALPHLAPATEDEAAEVACAWSDYRADYGVSPSAITEAHKAFKAGWAARRDGDTRGVLR